MIYVLFESIIQTNVFPVPSGKESRDGRESSQDEQSQIFIGLHISFSEQHFGSCLQVDKCLVSNQIFFFLFIIYYFLIIIITNLFIIRE